MSAPASDETADPAGAADGDAELASALEEYLASVETGRPPEVEQFVARHPRIAARLRGCLEGLRFLEGAVDQGSLTVAGGAQPAPPDGLARPGTLLGDYRLVRQVGRGGMGVVFEAVREALGRRVALKVLPLAGALDSRQLQRFRNEAQGAAQLHHPNIVPVHDVGCEHGVHFYAMQFVEGVTLAEIIDALRRPERARSADVSRIIDGSGLRDSHHRAAAGIALQAARALEYAHAQGVIHRDVKPSNLLLEADGHLWVADFGLARFQGEGTLTISGDLLGTLRYMSPEQALGRRGLVDQRADVYGLGATLYELLALAPLFDGEDREELLRQIALEEPRAPRRIDPSIPRDLETIVLKALAKDASGRYETAGDMAADLERFLAGESIVARRSSVLERTVKWARRHRQLTAALGVFLVIALVGLAVSTLLIWREAERTRDALGRVDDQRLRAERNLDRAREAIRRMLWHVAGEHLIDVPGMANVRREVLEEALRLCRAAIAEGENEPALRLDAGKMHLLMGGILAGLARREDALASYRRGVETLDALADDLPDSADRRLSLCYGLARVGLMLVREGDDGAEGRGVLRRASALAWELDDEGFSDRALLERLAENHGIIGGAFRLARLLVEAEPHLENAVAIALELHGENADDPESRRKLARAYYELGHLLLLRTNEYGALDAFTRTVSVYGDVAGGATDGELPVFDRIVLSDALYRRGQILWTGGPSPEAEASLRRSVELARDLMESFPGTARHAIETSARLYELGKHVRAAGREDEARGAFSDGVALCLRVLDRLHADADLQVALVNHVARLAESTGDLTAVARTVLEALERVVKIGPIDAGRFSTMIYGVPALLAHDGGAVGRDATLRPRIDAVLQAVRRHYAASPAVLERVADAHERLGEPALAILALEASRRAAWGSDARAVGRLERLRGAVAPLLVSRASVDAAIDRPPVVELVGPGVEWRYRRGVDLDVASPTPAWTSLDFDDSDWERGATPIGYGSNGDHQLATTIADMRHRFTSLFLRRELTVSDPDSIGRLILRVAVDDGLVAYLDGVELGRIRAGVEGEPLSPVAVAETVAPEPPIVEEIDCGPRPLAPGRHVLALHALNQQASSSDLLVAPVLVGELRPTLEDRRGRLEVFRPLARESGREDLATYFEARLLALAGEHRDAIVKYRELAAVTETSPERDGSHLALRIAESLRLSGDAESAAREIRDAIERGRESGDLWRLWLAICGGDLRLEPSALLERLPTAPGGAPSPLREDIRRAFADLAAQGAIRINSGGGPYRRLDDALWGADRFFTGGRLFFGQRGGTLYSGGIAGTDDPQVYRSERWFGSPNAAYRIPLPPSRYRIALHFAEIRYAQPAARVFDVVVEGERWLERFEPFASGFATAVVETRELTIDDGCLDIEFVHRRENPKISGIEIVRLDG